MLNKKSLTTVAVGAFAACAISYSSHALARQPVSVESVSDLGSFTQVNAVPAADLLLASLKHNAEPIDDSIAVAALDSTGIPALPNFNRQSGGKGDYNVFGSVVVPVGTLPAAKGWSHALGPDVANVFGADCVEACGSGLSRMLSQAARNAEALPTLEALDVVNRAVNRNLGYRSDSAAWGKSDYWAQPREIVRKGVGDCEDFATTKLWLLRSIGFDDSQLQLVVLKDTRRQLFHAVLAVHVDGRAYILDNLSNTVANDTAFRSYVPIMSFVGGKNYLHGFEDQRMGVAIGDMSAVLPGE